MRRPDSLFTDKFTHKLVIRNSLSLTVIEIMYFDMHKNVVVLQIKEDSSQGSSVFSRTALPHRIWFP
jgi:hypothetical protein